MPRFKCLNEKCENFNVEEYHPRITYTWNEKLMRFECEYSFCPVCGEFREPIKEYAGFTEAWFKAESCRNYNNKEVKKVDWDHDSIKETNLKLSKKK